MRRGVQSLMADGWWCWSRSHPRASCCSSCGQIQVAFFATTTTPDQGDGETPRKTRAEAAHPPEGLADRSSDTPHFTFYDRSVEAFASKDPRPIAIQDTFQWSLDPDKLIESARYLHRDIPIRSARTVKNFQALPYIVGENPHINRIYTSFWEGFQRMSRFPPIETLEDEKKFNKVLMRQVSETESTAHLLGWGIKEVRALPASLGLDYEYLDEFIEELMADRLSRRLLVEQHIALHTPRDNYRGVFNTRCKPHRIITNALGDAAELCENHFGSSPVYRVEGDKNLTFTYIPQHLEYVLLELFKNSARATMERREAMAKEMGGRAGGRRNKLPQLPIQVEIGLGKDDSFVHIIIRDQGGGIPRNKLAGANSVWSYGFTTTTASMPLHQTKISLAEEHRINQQFQLAGWGFGLPMSRLYVRQLGGDITLYSMPGYGTTVYLSFPNLLHRMHSIYL
eukprot:GGOE01001418.1.p1 GENE.GGOE01001418.1~~GGOE01001418.1.p1  ORF type:complete len:454 (-),score=105.27 GGOE01001418.1:126-1487(-)